MLGQAVDLRVFHDATRAISWLLNFPYPVSGRPAIFPGSSILVRVSGRPKPDLASPSPRLTCSVATFGVTGIFPRLHKNGRPAPRCQLDSAGTGWDARSPDRQKTW